VSNGKGHDGKGNGSDKQHALSVVRRQLAAMPPRRRLEAIIESPDADALVRSLPAEDLYFTMMEVGLADATELVRLAAPSQFRAFVDLGGWRKDRILPHEVLTWLRAAREDEPEPFLQKLHAVDLEVLEFLLREFTLVHDLEDNPDVHVEGVTLETPEGRYLVEFKGVEGPELAAMRALLNDLIAENPFEAVRLLEATRWEVPGELEESAYRFRTARLQDMGFPPLEEAMRLFSRVDTGASPTPPPSTAALAPGQPPQVDYLEAAFRALDEVERENLEAELRYLANATLVAEVEDPGDLDAIRRVGEMARDYLLLGLEHLTGGDPSRAPEVVRDTHLKRIFQVGFSLTLALKFRADRLMKQPLARVEDTPLVIPEEEAALEALRRTRPRRALRVPGAEPVSFRSRRELAASEALLARAEAQVTLLGALLGGTEARAKELLARFGVEPRVLGLERLFAGMVALALLEGRVDARPLPADLGQELGEHLFEGTPEAPHLRADSTSRALAVLEPVVPESARPELRRLVDVTLARLLEELAPSFLREGRMEPILSVLLPMEGEPPAPAP
jgi:hypothetical protein